MTCFLISLFCASLQADPPDNSGNAAAISNSTARSISSPEADVAVEQQFENLQAQDDAAQTEIQKWTRENAADAELKQRVRQRLDGVATAYEDFLKAHPNHARAHLVYGSFLADREDEAGAQAQWEKALQLDPKLAEAYNNLAGIYTETGQTRKAFDYFTKAIDLAPSNAAFYHNFGDSIYVLRKGIIKEFGLTEQQVYAKAMERYADAVRLQPTNFLFASDLAQTYYALSPLPYEAALKSWTNALQAAADSSQRQRVYVHLARTKMLAGRYVEARAQLSSVTNEECAVLKSNLLTRIAEREQAAPDSKTKN